MTPPATRIHSARYRTAAADDEQRPPLLVDERAQIVEGRGEPDDGRGERRPDAARLSAEFLHPVVIHAAGRRVRLEARVEMRRELAAHLERQRHADEQCHHPDAEKQRRRAVYPANAVAQGMENSHRFPGPA